MEFLEIKAKNTEEIAQIIEIEKEAFGVDGGVDEWILKPIVRYGKVYVLKKSQEVVGVAEYIRNFDGKEIYLYGFCIKKEYRKMGYGKELLKRCVEVFEGTTIEKISLTVAEENEQGIKLYEKLKFENKGLLKDEYGKGVDRLHLVRKI